MNVLDSPRKGNKQMEHEYGKKISTLSEEHL